MEFIQDPYVVIGLWCSDCFMFLDHKLFLISKNESTATYYKLCSQCDQRSKEITIDISIWEEISAKDP